MGNYIPTCPCAHTHVHPYSSPHPLILILLLEWVWVDSIIWKLPGTSNMQCAAWVKNDHPKWIHLPWHTIFLFSDLSLTPSIEYSLNNLVPIHKNSFFWGSYLPPSVFEMVVWVDEDSLPCLGSGWFLFGSSRWHLLFSWSLAAQTHLEQVLVEHDLATFNVVRVWQHSC